MCKGIANDLHSALQQRTLVTDVDKRKRRLDAEAAKVREDAEIAAAAVRAAKHAAVEKGMHPAEAGMGSDVEISGVSGSLESRPASSSQVSLGFENSVRLPSLDGRDGMKSTSSFQAVKLDDNSVNEVEQLPQAVSREEGEGDETDAGHGIEGTSEAAEPEASFLDEYRPSLHELSHYEAHLSKLMKVQSLTISHELDKDEENVEVLGKKSFWWERYGQLVREKRAEEDRIHAASIKPYDPTSSAMFFNVGHPLSRDERIAMLHATIKDRRDNMTM